MDYDQALEVGFGILLGRPLSEFEPADEYAVSCWNDAVDGEFFEDLDPRDLLVVHPPSPAAAHDVESEWPLSWDRFGVDLARSWFGVDDIEDMELDPEVTQVILAASIEIGGWCRVRGVELGRILIERGVDPADIEGVLMPLNAQVRTDGSLLDAMRAATWTMGGPSKLVPFPEGCEVDPPWGERLAAVAHEGVRDHLRGLCLDAHDARCEGAFFEGASAGELDWLEAQEGVACLAGWSFGEGQAAVAVFAIRRPR